MSLTSQRQKTLPDIRVDAEASGIMEEECRFLPSSRTATLATSNKVLPPIKVENTLSEEEMQQLHDLWNGAVLSARAHRRRYRCYPGRIPAPISVPDTEKALPALPSADPCMMSTTPPLSAKRKWGFLSARPFTSKEERAKKGPSALETLRSLAQDRLKKRLRYAKSAPNLGDESRPEQPPVPIPVQKMSKEVEASGPRTPGTPEEVLQSKDMDENAIYFTIDPSWRASRGSVRFQFITPIPDSPTSLGRPDSPLLHRWHSLDQLSFAVQEGKFPEECPSDASACEIDQLHSYLDLGP